MDAAAADAAAADAATADAVPSTGQKAGSLILREIHAAMHGGGHAVRCRPGTARWDPAEPPAPGLAGLYTSRWEEELCFRELKTHVHGADSLRHAPTVECGNH